MFKERRENLVRVGGERKNGTGRRRKGKADWEKKRQREKKNMTRRKKRE
jgi:hypothetical protein